MSARRDRAGIVLVLIAAAAIAGGVWRWTAVAPAAAPPTPDVSELPPDWVTVAHRALPRVGEAARAGTANLPADEITGVLINRGAYDLWLACAGEGGEATIGVSTPDDVTIEQPVQCGQDPDATTIPVFAGRAGAMDVGVRAGLSGAIAWQLVAVRPVTLDVEQTAKKALVATAAVTRVERDLAGLAGAAVTELGMLPPGHYEVRVVCVGDGAARTAVLIGTSPQTRHVECNGEPFGYRVDVDANAGPLMLTTERLRGSGFLVLLVVRAQ
jgi:hypothetical protein